MVRVSDTQWPALSQTSSVKSWIPSLRAKPETPSFAEKGTVPIAEEITPSSDEVKVSVS